MKKSTKGENMSKVKQFIDHSSKTEKFLMIIVAIIVISTLLSLIVKVIMDTQSKDTYKIAVVIPSNAQEAKSILKGAQSYVESINKDKTSHYRYEIVILKDNDSELVSKVKSLSEDSDYVGVIGFYNNAQVLKSVQNIKVPIYSFSPTNTQTPKNVHVFTFDEVKKSQFIANYMRNVKKEHFAYFAHDNSLKCQQEQKEFETLYKRFEIPLKGSVSTQQGIQGYFDKVDFGAVYICGDENSSVKILKSIKSSKTELTTYSSEVLALNSAKNRLADPSNSLDGIFVPTPLLFDTSSKMAQNFLNNYVKLYNTQPDWLGAISYDMAQMAFEKALKKATSQHGVIRDYEYNKNLFTLPLKMGQYNGDQIVSAPIQLQEIANKHSISNYIQAMRDGRVLYVNDSFMYKTNVVYTGIKINSISKIKQDEETAQIDFSIWFRYQGNFEPSDIMFLNSDVVLQKPEEKIDMENDHYVRFRTKGVFKLNFSKNQKSYGVNTVNIIYRHKKLNHNNLLFVSDLLGMPNNKEMIAQINDRKVIDTAAVSEARDFSISQSLLRDYSEGKPQYIGFQGEDALFSVVNMELRLESSMITANDFIPKKYFIYLMIFGFVGLIGARLMDSKRLGRYWYIQSYVLRLVFFPMLLIALGNMILDWAYVSLDHLITSYLVVVYETLWWLLPAYLIDSAIRRFVWYKIEEKAGKKIPAIIVILVTFVIYALSISGIIAFVFHEELTSMLAASGVIAMVVGFAIQANIANIFSGLVLNMDRPFKVGEIVELDDICGEVLDISWRTTKIKNWDGIIYTIPNDQLSNTQMKNISRTEVFLFEKYINLNPDIDPTLAAKLINEALMQCETIVEKDHEYYGAEALYSGHVIEGEQWVGRYLVWMSTKDYYDYEIAENELWSKMYEVFKRENLELYKPE